MNSISADRNSLKVARLELKNKRKFIKYLIVMLFIAIISSIAFNGSYFVAKHKISDKNFEHSSKVIQRNVRQIDFENGFRNISILLTNLDSNIKLEDKLKIFIEMNTSSIELKQKQMQNKETNGELIEYITPEAIDIKYHLRLEKVKESNISQTIGSIAVKDIIALSGGQTDGSIILNTGSYSFKMKIILK